MNTVADIVARNGGLEFLPGRSPLLVHIDPRNHFTIEYIGESPNRLPAVSVSFFNKDRGDNWHRQVVFEKTDLCWLPFQLVNKKDPMVLDVYELNGRGRVRKVNRAIRFQLVQITQVMDEELEVLLSPDELVLT